MVCCDLIIKFVVFLPVVLCYLIILYVFGADSVTAHAEWPR